MGVHIMTAYPALLFLLVGIVSPGPTCWYRAEYCSVEDGEEVVMESTSTNISELAEACYQECHHSQTCQEFTLLFDTEAPRCYHFQEDCSRVVGDPCISQMCCISGPKTCDESPEKTCTRLVTADHHYKAWHCTAEDGQQLDQGDTQVPAGTVCFLRCPSYPGHLTAWCVTDGTWSVSQPSTDSTPLPDTVPGCTCDNLVLDYDPNKEDSASFTCTQPVVTEGGQYTITPTNQCVLYCDGLYVTTYRCRQAQWTGQP